KGHTDVEAIHSLAEIEGSGIAIYSLVEFHRARQWVQDHGIRLHAPEYRRINSVLLHTGDICHALGPNPGLIDDVDLADHTFNIGFHLITNRVFVEIFENIWLHLQFRWADKKYLDPVKLGEQISKGARSTAPVELANHGDAQAVERTLAINGVKVEQGLSRVLSAHTVAGVDHRHRRNLSRPPSTSLFVVTDHNHVAVATDNANRIFNLFPFNFRREDPGLFGGEYAASQAVHGSFEAEAGAG